MTKHPEDVPLLGLPREIRQQILIETFDFSVPTILPGHNVFQKWKKVEGEVKQWSAKLRGVHPTITAELDFVETQWKQQLEML